MPDGRREFDAATLPRRVRCGAACVVCDKSWPAPPVKIGATTEGDQVRACRGCAQVLPPPPPPVAELPPAEPVAVAATLLDAARWYHLRGPQWLPDGLPCPSQALRLVRPDTHPAGHAACTTCATAAAAQMELARHIQRDELPLADPTLPQEITGESDARAWVRAWASDVGGIPGSEVVAVLRTVAAAVLARPPELT
ncbi:hypothetical protein [Actinomadura flavalba]|uniref:hypothetical protein n=1 Tax=Actinomadura flavalba TaxID=1120938 RepID=UPI000372C128|nr:hypothetical protein [Actinomadura flavalba]